MPTLKEFNREEFWNALDAYKEALKTGKNITGTSLRIHAAQGLDGVPRYFRKYVTKAWKETKCEKRGNLIALAATDRTPRTYLPFGGKNGCRIEDASVCKNECAQYNCKNNPYNEETKT